MPIRGVLFDSGDTLLRPVGGRWNPRFDFEAVLLRHVPDAPVDRFPTAFEEGDRFLASGGPTPERDEYHRVVLGVLGIARPSAGLLRELDRPLDVPPLEPFPVVGEVLRGLRQRGIPMAVVTDNWTSIDGIFTRLGLRGFFDAFVVSAALGCTKPDPRTYRAGSDGLGLDPPDCLFVDDVADLVRAAIELGYRGRVIDRSGVTVSPEVPSIVDLREVITLVDQERGR